MKKSKTYWNNKYPKIDKLYEGRMVGGKRFLGFKKQYPISVDVRRFISDDDLATQALINKIFDLPVLSIINLPDDVKIFEIQQWVMENIKYYGDMASWGANEFWQFLWETDTLLMGDCEDGAILIANLLLNAGVAPWRVHVTCGWVKTDKEDGGHAYVTYCRGDDWVPIDWCYYPELSPLKDRKPMARYSEYHDVWFSFNNLYCWSHEDIPAFRGRCRSMAAV